MFMQGFGHPRSNAADIELVDKQNRLIFSTIVNGAFYNRLKKHPFISITGLKGTETMNSVAVTVNGKVEEVDDSYMDQIYQAHPEMVEIDSADSRSSRSTLRPFAITPIDGSVYDLRQKPVFQKHFNF
ncbi:hypothetical protein FC37_GL000300 [Lactobacillus gallinarum DSM 10532 = JCM 2011]|uniref:Pyridoxamine 5'-phosphate oxidase putative domain-containing protein n=2 Tax=Lactobacillus gallinarum TaxID=52242 RepID=A0A0R1NUZ3_9LACO|nr:hypothetical protein FC37_GL000300 [Lactobacillus gallinarum DSM 10532 = JCM 2011]MBM6973918.1 pyridoxamine 5'-phosphate oxidase family protein [Lactobacillus gallinarum]